eukprot:scaffold441780_cov75-Attheya_sp.AAC.1
MQRCVNVKRNGVFSSSFVVLIYPIHNVMAMDAPAFGYYRFIIGVRRGLSASFHPTVAYV